MKEPEENAAQEEAGAPSRPRDASRPALKDEDEPMLYCPACSTRLAERKCKLVCPQCGYYLSCADYY